jgi:diguanylate cyclase (GGDEF)-like protein
MRAAAGVISLAFSVAYLFAASISIWLGRKERLKSRWPMIVLTALHAIVLLVGFFSSLDGALGPGETPKVLSLFGFVHFEIIVFALGTAVFMIALAKSRSEAASAKAASVDPLTGVANRRAFMECAERSVRQGWRENTPTSVIMFDLDGFKAINDTYGHAIGDAVIQNFCETVTHSLWPNDVFGRLGREEFALVLPRASIEMAYARAERIRISFEENCCSIGSCRVGATVSCGVSVSANAEHTLSELLKLSDVALYRAKADGKNRVKRADRPKPSRLASQRNASIPTRL